MVREILLLPGGFDKHHRSLSLRTEFLERDVVIEIWRSSRVKSHVKGKLYPLEKCLKGLMKERFPQNIHRNLNVCIFFDLLFITQKVLSRDSAEFVCCSAAFLHLSEVKEHPR